MPTRFEILLGALVVFGTAGPAAAQSAPADTTRRDAPGARSAPQAPQPAKPDAAPPSPAAKTPSSPKPTERLLRGHHGTYDETVSRDLFRACDGNDDDRLDVLEASDALETLRSPRDTARFATLDENRDGFVEWTEFDALFRKNIDQHGSFRVRVCRPFAPTTQEPRRATPLQQFLQAHDADRDGALSLAEAEQIVDHLGLDQALKQNLALLDRDGSGRIEEAELAAFHQQLPFLQRGTRPALTLPPPFGAADLDRNGQLDAQELTRSLRRIDPALARWAPQLLRRFDRDGDGRLGGAELPGAAPAEPTPRKGDSVPAR